MRECNNDAKPLVLLPGKIVQFCLKMWWGVDFFSPFPEILSTSTFQPNFLILRYDFAFFDRGTFYRDFYLTELFRGWNRQTSLGIFTFYAGFNISSKLQLFQDQTALELCKYLCTFANNNFQITIFSVDQICGEKFRAYTARISITAPKSRSLIDLRKKSQLPSGF